MFRISVIEESSQDVVLKLEGRLVSRCLLVLVKECRHRLGLGKRVVLDLAGVTRIDLRSARFIKAFQKYDVEIVNPSVVLRNLLSIEDP